MLRLLDMFRVLCCAVLCHIVEIVVVGQKLFKTYLGVGNTTVVPRLGEGLVLAVTVAASRSSSHLEYFCSKLVMRVTMKIQMADEV